jgi:hypothetical protein
LQSAPEGLYVIHPFCSISAKGATPGRGFFEAPSLTAFFEDLEMLSLSIRED